MTKEQKLYNWMQEQKKDYKAGKLNAEQISLLEALPNWSWD